MIVLQLMPGSHYTTRYLVSGVIETLCGSCYMTGRQQGGVTHNKTFGEEESLMSWLGLHHVFFHDPCPASVLDFRTNVDMLPHAKKKLRPPEKATQATQPSFSVSPHCIS